MQLFYTPGLSGDTHVLDETESKHCIRVLRLTVGDTIYLSNGAGSLCTAEIVSANPKRCELQIVSSKNNYGKRGYYLHIAIAPTKNIDRFEWFIEKCTEIGIDEISPLVCSYSERKTIKPERLERIMVSAMKQSIKAYKPKLNPMLTYQEFLANHTEIPQKYIAYCSEGEKNLLRNCYDPPNDALILIGPEGDFSPEEVESARQAGFLGISLGDSRLRTETAAVAACHSIAFMNH